jgi:4-hydroxybenzoate polyprenyltransferase
MLTGVCVISNHGSAVVFGSLQNLLEMIKFSHTVFALPFALLSATLAWQRQPFHVVTLLGLLLCMVFARSAAMAFNRLADQSYDGQNPRTASRHLPTGRLSRRTVWLFTIVCSAGFVVSTALFLIAGNPWPLYLSVPVLAFLLLYSYAKRFTVLSHFWLGAALMLAPVAAWIAVCGMTNLSAPLLLGLAVLFWVAGFDIIYACQDIAFDIHAGLKSMPAYLGVRNALRLSLVCHAAMVACLALLPWAAPGLGAIYLLGVAAVALLLLYEHWLVQPGDLTRVNAAFFYVNGIISVWLLAVVWVQLAVNA